MQDPRLRAEDQALELLAEQKALLISVATGGPQIQEVEGDYKKRRQHLVDLLGNLSLRYPFPWRSLWDWHGAWKSAGFPTYASRRKHISDLARNTEEALEKSRAGGDISDWGAPNNSWLKLEERLDGLKAELQGASSLDDLQDVGRRCREILIDAAGLACSAELLGSEKDPPKDGDAKRKIEIFLDSRAGGSGHVELRKLVRTTWDLANAVTHSSSAGRVDAFAAAQATVMLVRILHEIETSDS